VAGLGKERIVARLGGAANVPAVRITRRVSRSAKSVDGGAGRRYHSRQLRWDNGL